MQAEQIFDWRRSESSAIFFLLANFFPFLDFGPFSARDGLRGGKKATYENLNLAIAAIDSL